MKVKDGIILYHLARRRLRSEDDYRKFQRFQANLLLEYMQQFDIDIEGKLVLDLGSGLGGYGQEIAQRGATVIALDLIRPLGASVPRIYAVIADALSIPLQNETVDFVFCASLIEHISNPTLLIAEIHRVLKNEQYCYLSFPPFYSPYGGHEFSPFHYFGERCAIWLYFLLKRRRPEWAVKMYKPNFLPRSFANIYQSWGLYKLTIAQVIHIVRQIGLKIIDISPRYLPINTARWPILGEFLTWHVQFLLKKCKF